MYSPNTSPKKPSPLSHPTGSPRASPFKRPTSQQQQQQPPGSAPGTPRSHASPAAQRNFGATATGTPPRRPAIAEEDEDEDDAPPDVFAAPSYPTNHSPSMMRPSSRGAGAVPSPRGNTFSPRPTSPAVAAASVGGGGHAARASSGSGSAAAKVNPNLLREMHESFQAMDGDGDGSVNAGDVAEALGQLGQNAHPATLTTFFPPGSSPGMSLPTYISALSAPLAALSPPAELAAAFSAFDADDSGQIDVAELRNALLVTGDGGMSPREVDAVLAEFTGRRAFAKGQTGPRGDVFRWRDFVGATSGAGAGTAPVEAEGRAA